MQEIPKEVPLASTFLSPTATTRTSPPRTIPLAGGELLFLESHEESLYCAHTGSDDEVWLTGAFAEAMLARSDGAMDSRQRALLTQLGRGHPWLRGVVEENGSVADLVLGREPGMLFIEMTARCNERCLHCYAESTPERYESLTIEEIRNVLTDIRKLGDPAIQFTGGDPLIHPHLPDAVAIARKLGYSHLEIYTNGLLLNDSMLGRLAPHAPDFAFSLYSHDTATHDRITRLPGSHGRTIAAIRRAMAAGSRVRVGVILMPENRGHERATRTFLQQELGLEPDRITFDTVKGTGRGAFTDYEPDLEDTATGSHATPTDTGDEPDHTGRKGKLCIAPDGTVYPCIFSRGTVLGNIRSQTLAQIIAGIERRNPSPPSAERWHRCREQMSCEDCRMIAYTLGIDDEDNA